ncbi:MAG: hypothetical protein OIN86_13605 [Candidatus Methanoperedens sp.]|nr:hypothetical protein [Candidatus Methanoperedens sp.]CAG0950633.1 hypothetical protein METP1_00178 [Methanosarcinales archaeon]
MIDVNTLRPSGIRRKLMMSAVHVVTTAGNYIIGHFPHGATLRGIWFVPTVALTVADEVMDIGITATGKTIIDAVTVPYTTSAIGTPVDIFQTKGTTGGLTELAAGATVWATPTGASTAGTGFFVIEYEDRNN